ncbi:hypothetical protein [Carnobacterium mobile]|uniref:hypothetical protein n=1 Tax=Carnobacterium mobile TaxID=2750 RepID=UPI000553EF29|nr:hypothetical protein [Carnobacterium mobile]
MLFLILPKVIQPDKILQVGSQISESSYKFSEEIKDEEKIVEFENWFDRINFTEEIGEPDGYADIVLQIRHYKEGISTHPISIWVDEDEATVTNEIGSEDRVGKLSSSQLDDLRKIIDSK